MLEDCFERFFEPATLRKHEEDENWAAYNFQLRLRDFASLVEGDQAMRAGDIGRVFYMMKRWAVMAQGFNGLTHYARQIPRFILLLEEDLPKDLARAIKHSLLLPSSTRANHFIAKDLWLEYCNCWLKHIYNNTVGGPLSTTYTMFLTSETLCVFLFISGQQDRY